MNIKTITKEERIPLTPSANIAVTDTKALTKERNFFKKFVFLMFKFLNYLPAVTGGLLL